MSHLFDSFLATPEVTDALSAQSVVQAMLRFEAALARAQASAGLIPHAAAQSIIGTCKVALFDVPRLVFDSARLRSPSTPLVSSLRETVALFNKDASAYVHFGCTDQDLADTTLALVSQPVLGLIQTDLAQCTKTLLTLAAQHAGVPMLDRGAESDGALTTFGLQCTQWAAPLVRSQQRLATAADNALGLQLSLALTPGSAMQNKGAEVLALVATDLQLKTPAVAGITPHDDWLALACELGLMAGNLGTLAAGVAHLAQFEVSELSPPAAPEARVPGAVVVASVVSPATQRAMVQSAAQRVPHLVAGLMATLSHQHTLPLGHWQTRLAQWPALLQACQSMVRAMAQLLSGLQVDAPRMRLNLDAKRANLPNPGTASPDWLQQAAGLARTHITALQAQQQPGAV